MKKSISLVSLFTLSVTIAFIVFLGVLVVYGQVPGWVEPGFPPPQGNVAAPINVGTLPQSKQAGLNINTGIAPIGLMVGSKTTLGVTNFLTQPIPSETLDVLGNINITGIIKPNGNAGNVGQVLTRTTNGMDWQPVAGASCSIVANSKNFAQSTSIPVPSRCLNGACQLIFAVYFTSNDTLYYHVLSPYWQIPSISGGTPNRWASSLIDPGATPGWLSGVNGNGLNETIFLSGVSGNQTTLNDDGIENSPTNWTVFDNSFDKYLVVYSC